MKVAIVGKGGVGKTTLAAMLAKWRAARGHSVIAVDADADGNLAAALGLSPDKAPAPIAQLKQLIRERTEADNSTGGLIFKLNPKVDDLPDRFSVAVDGVRLLVLGTVETGGTGCLCPENTVLKNLLQHLLLRIPDDVILDMEAGLEHLGRASASGVDAMVAVVEPGMRSVQTAQRVTKLASDIGVKHTLVVANKIRSPEEVERLQQSLGSDRLIGWLPYEPTLVDADLAGQAVPFNPHDANDRFGKAVEEIAAKLEQFCLQKSA